jgi:hypothetical protein
MERLKGNDLQVNNQYTGGGGEGFLVCDLGRRARKEGAT